MKGINEFINESMDKFYFVPIINYAYGSGNAEIEEWYGPYNTKADALKEAEFYQADFNKNNRNDELYINILTSKELIEKIKIINKMDYDESDIEDEAYPHYISN